MRFRPCLFQTLLLLVPALSPALSQAAVPGQTQWNLNTFTWIKRVPAEPGAPANSHPAVVAPGALQALLGSVQAKLEGHYERLFTADELKALSKALSEALAQAQAGEDLILLSTYKRGSGFLEKGVGITARLFVRAETLNLLVHDARLEFMDRYLADRTLPTFHHGSRQTPSGVALQAPVATVLRSDWLALPLALAKVEAPTATTTTAPAPKPSAEVAPEAPAGPKDVAFYAAQTQRLKALKQMRDEGLLTEAEYQQKREAILKTL